MTDFCSASASSNLPASMAPIEARVAHDTLFMLAQIGFDVGGKVRRLVAVEAVMRRQRFVTDRRPVADLLLSGDCGVPLRSRSFVNDTPHEIDFNAKL